MAPKFAHRRSCAACGKVLQGSTPKSLASAVNRHRREAHGDGTAIERRQAQQKSRLNSVRALQPSDEPAHSRGIVYVTSLRRREALWEAARDEFLRLGMAPGCVRRRLGIDMVEYDSASQEQVSLRTCGGPLPEGLRRSTFLMFDFYRNFLPLAVKVLEERPEIDWVAWAEDDIKFPAGRKVAELHEGAMAAGDSGFWAAFRTRGGKPVWGAHLVVVTTSAAQRILRCMDEEAQASRARGKPWSHLLALDTWIAKMCDREFEGAPLFCTGSSSLATQRAHPFKGRR